MTIQVFKDSNMNDLTHYFRTHQVPLQWSPILRALAVELTALLGSDLEALKALFRKTGERYAAEMAEQFEGIETLDELAEAFNELWQQSNWGLVTLNEAADGIEIAHQFAPLAQAFGVEELTWSSGFLEGFYQHGFQVAGAGSSLKVRVLSADDDGLSIHLKLAH
jgi:hypothetical protein